MVVELTRNATPATPMARPWLAVDTDVEARSEREARRPVPWRESLMRWLIEFNKY